MPEPLSDEQRERLTEALWEYTGEGAREIADALVPVVADMLAEVQSSLDHWQHSAKVEAARLREAKERAEAAEARYDALATAVEALRDRWATATTDAPLASEQAVLTANALNFCAREVSDLIGGDQ